jgi:hypothetical protein
MALATNDGGAAPIILTGRFVSPRRFVGTLVFSGGRQDPHCDSRLAVVARLRILTRYRTDHFAGLTVTGDRLSFYRTVATRPQVVGLNAPAVTAQCATGGTEQKAINDHLGFNTPVTHGAFSYGGEDDSSEFFTFKGRFTSSTTATGTLGLSGRDDCDVNGLRWSAKRVGPGPVVTLTSH